MRFSHQKITHGMAFELFAAIIDPVTVAYINSTTAGADNCGIRKFGFENQQMDCSGLIQTCPLTYANHTSKNLNFSEIN